MKSVDMFASTNSIKDSQRRLKTDQLRAPWVPAPAKSSSAALLEICSDKKGNQAYAVMNSSSSSTGDAVVNQSQNQLLSRNKKTATAPINKVQSSRNMKDPKSGNKLQTSSSHQHSHKQRQPSYQRHVRKPSSQFKKAKNPPQRTGMQYRLQSKDSLVDVTACLQEKRKEVMKLWEKSLLKNDPYLHANIESANRFALEAAEEVEKLRRKIQEFQHNEDGLSEADCTLLEQMRIAVLNKVKQFEEADNLLQENIAKQSVSKTSLGSAMSKTSQVESSALAIQQGGNEGTLSLAHPQEANKSMSNYNASNSRDPDVIVLKEKNDNFSDESECDTFDIEFGGNNPAFKSNAFDNSTGAAMFPHFDNLHNILSLYEESINLPQIQEIMMLSSTQGGVGAGHVTHVNQEGTFVQESSSRQRQKLHSNQRVRFTKDERKVKERGESFSGENDFSTSVDLYREKISILQRQLMNTEFEVEELKAEVERIDSDANLRVRILQNTVQDKFDSLQAIPDYLEMVDQKLSEIVQEKHKLQNALDGKDMIIKEFKERNENLEKKTISLQEHLRKVENTNDFLSLKNADLEKTNDELRKQVEELTNKVAQMTCENKNLNDNEHKTVPTLQSKHDFKKENQKLKLYCLELKEEINQARRLMQTLRKSKTKLVTNLTERIEELMDALQAAQQHKRLLGDQIRYLKKTYHELFPAEMFKPVPLKKTLHVSRSNFKRKAPKVEEKPVDEPKVQSTVAWKTGSGIKIDDLLQVNIS